MDSSARRIFERGEAKKFEINEDQNENFSAQNQVRFSAQNYVKTPPKKRSSLKFSPVFGQKRSSPTVSVLKPSAQVTKGGRACHNFAYFSMLLYYPGDPKGGAMAQCPPLNTPLVMETKSFQDSVIIKFVSAEK